LFWCCYERTHPWDCMILLFRLVVKVTHLLCIVNTSLIAVAELVNHGRLLRLNHTCVLVWIAELSL
jgi:hypothetical protein